MSDVQIPRIHDRFLIAQLFEILDKILLVFGSERKAFELFSGVRDIGSYKVEVLELKGDNPSFLVVFVIEESVVDT